MATENPVMHRLGGQFVTLYIFINYSCTDITLLTFTLLYEYFEQAGCDAAVKLLLLGIKILLNIVYKFNADVNKGDGDLIDQKEATP
jgi:hypothetical protein